MNKRDNVYSRGRQGPRSYDHDRQDGNGNAGARNNGHHNNGTSSWRQHDHSTTHRSVPGTSVTERYSRGGGNGWRTQNRSRITDSNRRT